MSVFNLARLIRPAVFRALIAAPAVAGAILVMTPTPAAASLSGPCTVTASASISGAFDVARGSVWHLRDADVVTVHTTTPSPQHHLRAAVTFLGLSIPVMDRTGAGSSGGDAGPFRVHDFDRLSRVVIVSVATESCSADLTVIVDDANPLGNLGGDLGGVLVVGSVIVGGVIFVHGGVPGGRVLGIGSGVAALLGAGLLATETGNLLLPPGGPAHVGALVASIEDPLQAASDPTRLLLSFLIAAITIPLVAFPCELFNSTLEEHYDEVAGWLRLPRKARATAAGERRRRLRGPANLLIFTLASGVLYGFVDPGFGLNLSSLALYIGIVGAFVVVTLTFDLPSALHLTALRKERVFLHALPATLWIGTVCVVISRAAGLLPGYLYGAIAGYAFRGTRPQARDEGRAVAISSAFTFGLCLIAWFAWIPVKHLAEEPNPGFPLVVLDSLLAMIFLVGLQTVAFGLLPLRFLDGEKVAKWSRVGWLALFGLASAGLVNVLLSPRSGWVVHGPTSKLPIMIGALVAFGLASVAFWGFFWVRARREKAEAAEEALVKEESPAA